MKKRGLFWYEFSKIIIFYNQYKIIEIRKRFSMALMFTFDVYLK